MSKGIIALGLVVILTSCANRVFDSYSDEIDYYNYQGYYERADSIETSLNDSLNASIHLSRWSKDEGFKKLFWHGHIHLDINNKQFNQLLRSLL